MYKTVMKIDGRWGGGDKIISTWGAYILNAPLQIGIRNREKCTVQKYFHCRGTSKIICKFYIFFTIMCYRGGFGDQL